MSDQGKRLFFNSINPLSVGFFWHRNAYSVGFFLDFQAISVRLT